MQTSLKFRQVTRSRIAPLLGLLLTISLPIVPAHAQSPNPTAPSTRPVISTCVPTAKPTSDRLYQKVLNRASVGDGYVADVWKLDRRDQRGKGLTYFYALQRQGKLVANVQVNYWYAYAGRGFVGPFWAMQSGSACSNPVGHDYPIVWFDSLQVSYKVENDRNLPIVWVQNAPSWKIKVMNQLNAPDAGI